LTVESNYGYQYTVSTSGAVDIELSGAASATFSPAVTITMPVPGKAIGSRIDVYTYTGIKYTYLTTRFITTAGFVSFPVSSLSWKVCDPVFPNSGPGGESDASGG
jgi:hypothetical protein